MSTTHPDGRHSRIHLIMVLSGFLLLAGCAQIRYLTYPDSFTWLGEDDIKTTMQSMATALSSVNRLVDNEKTLGENRDKILVKLDEIEKLAASVATGSSDRNSNTPASNHQRLEENIDDFLDSILRARLQIKSNPSNYYGIGQLTGSCTSCHRLR